MGMAFHEQVADRRVRVAVQLPWSLRDICLVWMCGEQLGKSVTGCAQLCVRWQAECQTDRVGRMPGRNGEGVRGCQGNPETGGRGREGL